MLFLQTTQGLEETESYPLDLFLLFLSPAGVKATKFSLPQANTIVSLWHFFCVYLCNCMFVCRTVRGGGQPHTLHSLTRCLWSLSVLLLFFEHRSISTNSTGAVKTHLSDADASLDQKQPFYTTASFVLIHVSLLRDWLLFYLQHPSLNSPEAYWELVIILPDLLSDKGIQRPILSLNTNIMRLRCFLAWRKCSSLGLILQSSNLARGPCHKGWVVWSVQWAERGMAIC